MFYNKRFYTVLKKIFSDRDSKALFGNFFSLTSLKMVSLVLSLITLPYLIRVIGLSNYGVVILAISLISYFIPITDYSFRVTATRDVAAFRDDKKKLSLIYSEVMIVQGILQLLSIIVICATVFVYPPFFNSKLVFFLTIPALVGTTIFPDWFFQGIEKMKYIATLNLSVKVFFTFCIFLFIKKHEDYWMYALFNSLGCFIVGLLGQFILLYKYRIEFFWVSKHVIYDSFKRNFAIFLNQFFPSLNDNTNTLLLGILINTNAVGIYDAIKKIIDPIIVTSSNISKVFFPLLYRREGIFNTYARGMLLLGFAFTICPIMLSNIVFEYLDITYANAFVVLFILSIGIFALSLYNIYGLNYFVLKRQDEIIMNNAILSSLVGFVLSFPLIYYYGSIGAAVDLTLIRLLMGGGMLFIYIKKNFCY